MKRQTLPIPRVKQLIDAAVKSRVVVVGDVMLDHFIWGNVGRISPEAPVPVVDLQRESFIPGGAANVARNLTALGMPTELHGIVGRDNAATQLRSLLRRNGIVCNGVLAQADRVTGVKTRIVAHQQQVVRVDRESRTPLDEKTSRRLLKRLEENIPGSSAVIIGDYAKGVITQPLLDGVRDICRRLGVWLSLDPKPVHRLDIKSLSLITPNRREAFELAGIPDDTRNDNPFSDKNLMRVVELLLNELKPAILLVTLGELGMLLCQSGKAPHHIPTRAQEVFDVSGAGDTVIASFTLAIAAGASPLEAAIVSNHAAGIVVGKMGTATVSAEELLASFESA